MPYQVTSHTRRIFECYQKIKMAKKNSNIKLEAKKVVKKNKDKKEGKKDVKIVGAKKGDVPIISGIISGVLLEEETEIDPPVEKEVSPDALEDALEDEEDVAADIENMDDEDEW
jgi:hypothetical protein